MWRETPEVFWDGRRTLLVGFFGEAATHRRPLVVSSSGGRDFAGGGTLLDLLEPYRAPPNFWIIRLPSKHLFVRVLGDDGDELQIELVEKGAEAQGEWRIFLAEAHEAAGTPAFRIAAKTATAKRDSFINEQVTASGEDLVWATLQRRWVWLDNQSSTVTRMRVTAASTVYPAQEERLVLEPLPIVEGEERTQSTVRIALHEHVFNETQARRIRLKLRFRAGAHDVANILSRAALVHVMNQRRFIGYWIESRQTAGDAIISPITPQKVREAIGDDNEFIEAVESLEPIAVTNVARILSMPNEVNGIEVVDRQKTASHEIVVLDFFGATLGDFVGLVCNGAQEGEIIVPTLGASRRSDAWIFWVGPNGLVPHNLEKLDSELLQELLSKAADEEASSSGSAGDYSAASLTAELRSDFIELSINPMSDRALVAEIDSEVRSETFWPMWISAFAAEAKDRRKLEAIRQLGGFRLFGADPALGRALAALPDRSAHVVDLAAVRSQDDAMHLARRYSALRGHPDMVSPDLELSTQLAAWQMLCDPEVLRLLEAARITLDSSVGDLREPHAVLGTLCDEVLLSKVSVSYRDWQKEGEAAAIDAYLEDRRHDVWTPLAKAVPLKALVALVQKRWADNSARSDASPTAISQPDLGRTPNELIRDIEAVLAYAATITPPPSDLAHLRERFERLMEDEPDRFMLHDFETKLKSMLAAPEEVRKFETLIDRLEEWAELPGFLRKVGHRLPIAEQSDSDRRDLVAAYVNRVHRATTVPRRREHGGDFDRKRATLAKEIEGQFTARRSSREINDLAQDIALYGDILFFHKAYRAIREIADVLEGNPTAAPDLFRLRQSLSEWPRTSAQSWDMANQLRKAHAPNAPDPLISRLLSS